MKIAFFWLFLILILSEENIKTENTENNIELSSDDEDKIPLLKVYFI